MRELKVALVGCGYVTIGHLEAWRKVRQARIVAVSDLNEALAKSTAATWQVPNHYKTLSEIIAHGGVDVVDICTPPQVHASLAVEAMKARLNVLIEKPMTMTVKDAQQIVDCQKTAHVKAGVIHNWMFDEPILVARSLVKQRRLGRVFNVVVEALNTKEDQMAANPNHWCHRLPGGRFSEMLAHPIYLVRHFLGGEPEVADVQVSKVGGYAWMKSNELCATFRVGDKMGRAYASFNSSRDAIYVNLYCSEGILKLDIINSTVNILPKRRTSRLGKASDSLRQSSQLANWTVRNAFKVATGRWLSGHDMCIRLFAESLLTGGSPPVSVEDGLAVIRVLEDMCSRIETQENRS